MHLSKYIVQIIIAFVAIIFLTVQKFFIGHDSKDRYMLERLMRRIRHHQKRLRRIQEYMVSCYNLFRIINLSLVEFHKFT